jgi:predicted MFS family arabinose efflux permease
MFFLGIGTAVIGAASGNIGLSPFQTGLLVSVQNVGFTVAVLATGAMADTRSKPLLMAAGSLVLAVSFFLYYLWPGYLLNLAIMAVIGVGIGTYEGVSDPMLLSLHDRRPGLHISVNHFFVTFGSLALAVYLLFLQMSWRRSMVQSAAAVLVLALLFAAGWVGERRRPAAATAAGARGASLRERARVLAREPILALFLVLALLAVGIEAGLTGLAASFLIQLRGYDLVGSKIGLVLLLAGIAGGRVVLGLVSGKAGVPALLIGMNAAAAVLCCVLFFVPLGPAGIGVLLALTGMAVSSTLPLVIMMTGAICRDASGTALGVVKLGIPIGGIIVPFVISIVSRAWSFQAAVGVFPLLAAVGVAVLAGSAGSIRRRMARLENSPRAAPPRALSPNGASRCRTPRQPTPRRP